MRAWGPVHALLWTPPSAETQRKRGFSMADDESLLTNPPTQDVAVHVADYTRFTHLFKWGAVSALVIGLFILIFVL